MELNQLKQRPALWECLFAVLVLFFSTGAIIPLIRRENGFVFNPAVGDLTMQGLWLGIYLITFIFLSIRLRQVTREAYQVKLIWLLVGLAFISIIWSVSPHLTLRRSLALLGSTAFGVYLANRFTWPELLKMVAYALGLCAVLSVAFVVLLPNYGIHSDVYHDGAWRGVYYHKNILGRFMTLGAISWLVYSFINNRNGSKKLCESILGYGFFSLSVLLLFLSRSKSALVVFGLVLILFMIYLYRSGKRRYVLTAILIILMIGSSSFLLISSSFTEEASLKNSNSQIVAVNLPEVDLTLTGRTLLWQAVWDMAQQRPWLGYGYSAFWLGYAEPSGHIWRLVSWEPPNSHNGYLDLWLQLGLAGVLIFEISFLVNLSKSFLKLRKENSIFELFTLMFLLIMLINNISESFIMAPNCIFWILYVYISVKLSSFSVK